MMNCYKYIIIFFILYFITNCKQTDEINLFEELPSKTTEGKYTLGCKINGYSIVTNKAFGIRYLYYPGFSITTRYKKNEINFTNFDLWIDTLKVSKLKYNLEDVELMVFGQIQGSPYSFFNSKSLNVSTDYKYAGEVSFSRIDTVNGIYSGDFFIIKKSESSSFTESILDGRFDVKDVTLRK